jgi:hypothetical protein
MVHGQDISLLRPQDTIAWLGGARVVAEQRDGHSETLVAVAHPSWNLRWRSLAWEGDTVFSRPRELNFPPLARQLRDSAATVVLLQFGEMESLGGQSGLSSFTDAYAQLLDSVGDVISRRILISPAPLAEGLPGLNPERRAGLSVYTEAIRDLGSRKGIPVIELRSQEFAAVDLARRLCFTHPLARATSNPQGRFLLPQVEAVRQAVIARNRLWFDYSRPMNWAFLAGDRTEQASSRDHRDRNIRWFSAEMERFVPLIAEADQRIWNLSVAAYKEVR